MLKRRAYSDEAEFKYRTIRAGASPFKFYMGKVLDQQLRTHLQKEYRNESETIHTMKLTGMISLLRKSMVFRATRKDMKRFFQLAEKMRWDKTLDRADATALLFSQGIDAKKRKISLGKRPSDFEAQRNTPYIPRPGSSKGKIATQQKGAKITYEKFRKMMIEIFKIGDGMKAKTPKVSMTRTFTKTFGKY